MKINELFPYFCVKGADQAINFYKEAFGAREKFRLVEPSGRIGHAELELGQMSVMLSDEFPEYGIQAPSDTGGTAFQIHIHVDNADAFIARALKAGATMIRETQDQFYGERSGTIKDPFGHLWNIGHHIEDVAPPEMQRRYSELMNSSK